MNILSSTNTQRDDVLSPETPKLENTTSHAPHVGTCGANATPEKNTTDQIETLNSQNSVPENAAQDGTNANAPVDELIGPCRPWPWSKKVHRQLAADLLGVPLEKINYPWLFEDEESEDEEQVR